MRDVLGVLIFLGVGVLIVAAAVWYVTTVVNWWKADRGPPALGSVTVLGLADPQAKAMAAALPAIVLSELRRLGERTNQAKRQLQELEQTQSRQTFVQDPRFEPVPVPETLKMEVAIPQQVAGVEIGWLLSWIKDALAPTNVIDLTAAYEADGKKATVFGHAKGRTGYAFYIRDETGRPDEIAQAAAAAIIQHEQRRGEIAVQPLPPSAYIPVVDALSAYATYEKVVRSHVDQPNRPDFTPQYQSQLASLGKIAEIYVQWGELQWLAAEIAERAGDRAKALAFTQNEQRITPRNDPRYPRLAARLERLNERTVAAAAPAADRDAAREKAGAGVDAQLVAPFRAQLGIPTPPPIHAGVRLAFVGEPWPQALKAVQSTVLRKAKQQHESISDYATGLLQATRIIAPDAAYEFVGVETGVAGGLSESELVRALATVKESKPDILVFGYGPGNAEILRLLRELAGGMVVVIAAGNSAGTSSYASIDDVALVVSAADGSGAPAKFSDSSTRSVSAPGADIPIVSATTGSIRKSSGTSYSAAFAGGGVALLKASRPTATPDQIVNAVRETARQPARSIDVSASLRRLAEPSGSAANKK